MLQSILNCSGQRRTSKGPVECSLSHRKFSQFLKNNDHIACYNYCTDQIVGPVYRLPQLHRRHRDG